MKRVVSPIAKKPVAMAFAMQAGWRWYLTQPDLIADDLHRMADSVAQTPQTIEHLVKTVAVPYARASAEDKLGVLAEIAVVCKNHAVSLLEHHLCPPRVNGKLRLMGYSKAEAVKALGLYCAHLYDPVAPFLKYSRPSWARYTARPWVDAPSVRLPNKIKMVWDTYFPTVQ